MIEALLPILRPVFVSWGCALINVAMGVLASARWRLLAALVLVCSLGGLSACEENWIPTNPDLGPVASLAIEEFTIKVHPQPRGDFWYEPRFRLRETGGKSGATIQQVGFAGEALGPDCLGSLRVPPGEILDTFHTGEVAETWGYCALFGGGSTESPELQLVVWFKNDGGRRNDTVRATAIGSR